MSESRSTILVVDDQPMYRLGVGAILNAQSDLEVVGEAVDGAQAVSRARQLRPDVILMDVRMPNMNGIDATRRILEDRRDSGPRVLMLTTFDMDDYVFDALKAGASGFLLKDAGPDELVQAVRTIASGESLLAPRVTSRLIEQFVERTPAVLQSTTVLNGLTDREREVFELLARGRSNLEIASGLFIAEQTAKTHVSRVMAKLHLRDRVQAVVLGYETGIIRPGHGDGGAALRR